MTEYPDNWVIIFLNSDDPHYRVLAGWSGGYLSGDGWKLNSGIVRVEEHEYSYSFYGSSGSCYVCDKHSYGLRKNNAYIWNELKEIHHEKVQLMSENTNWMDMDWLQK